MANLANNNEKKLSTGIDGLDSLLYGGIHLESNEYQEDNKCNENPDNKSKDNKDKGLLVLTRGKHGVNKVHLAMQMCEGLHLGMESGFLPHQIISIQGANKDKVKKDILFVSLNKNTDRLRDTYIGFYLQRLINDFRVGKLNRTDFKDRLKSFYCKKDNEKNISRMICCEYKRSNPIQIEDGVIDGIEKGIVFYDERIHGLCLKSVEGNTPELYTLDMGETAKKMNIAFIGRREPELHEDAVKNDTLTTFERMIYSLKKLKERRMKSFNCVMVDGLSRMTEAEVAKCDFSLLTDMLRDICKVGVITADEKLPPTGIEVDIVIEMEIHEEHHPECVQNALKISKCLYQKHVYGWHSYKMRRTGIDVIPSIHFQMNSRFHMDDAVQDACFGIEDIPYRCWINESKNNLEDCQMHREEKEYKDLDSGNLFALSVDKMDDGKHLITKVKGLIDSERKGTSHFLFVDLSRTRKEFYETYHDTIKKKLCDIDNVHLFNFRPGHIHDDDFLYTIEKQVRAIARKIARIESSKALTDINVDEYITIDKGDSSKWRINEHSLWKLFKKIHLVIGDINYINFAYPCLNRDNLLLPAISNFTKKYHMTNFIYSTASWEISILEREKELYQQMKVVSTMLF